jgi:hypothetical protein
MIVPVHKTASGFDDIVLAGKIILFLDGSKLPPPSLHKIRVIKF